MTVLQRTTCAAAAIVVGWTIMCTPAGAQVRPEGTAVAGQVTDASTGQPLAGVLVLVEGSGNRVLSDSLGRYLLTRLTPGPQVLRAERIGFAPARISVTVPTSGLVATDIRMAPSALQMSGIIVTADPAGRARGELGTASVIEREAIRHQTAASLSGLLELVPGIPLQPPGLDGVQQISLRAAPVSGAGGEAVGPGAAALASAGTLIVLDGVPLSNNANLQSLGPRGELPLATAAGGGVDLRRIPATLIERVEVIRGVPSARYGDLTQGAVVVETRAGDVTSDIAVRRDGQTTEASILYGTQIGTSHAGTAMVNAARTLLEPGVTADESYRLSAQLAHTLRLGDDYEAGRRLSIDSRLDFFQLLQDTPERPELLPGRAAQNRDSGIRLSERLRLRLHRGTTLELSAAVDRQQQRSFVQATRQRRALPFTRQLTEGRAEGYFIGGAYIARVDVDGNPWLAYGRLEGRDQVRWLGLDHEVRAGAELRREWNSGPGYQFDMESPPQTTFNGVQGFDRPRSYDDVPPLATSAFYVDDRMTWTAGSVHIHVQAGLRMDVLHAGTNWFSGGRHTVLQPRLNLQLAPAPWLRVRAGAGRTAKYPTLADLHPAPQYHDLVNVNWYANNPAERLAVLTTYVLDATNPELRQMVTTKREAGFEIGLGNRGGVLGFVAFSDRVSNGIGLSRTPRHLLREHFQLADSTTGSGAPPRIIEPAYRADTVPVLLLRPANTLLLDSRGYEGTFTLPEIRQINTRLEVQGAWIWTRLESAGIEVGPYFSDFQLRGERSRTPYWDGTTRTGDRLLLNYRVIHQQPSVGLVITTTIQHSPRESMRTIGGRDSLEYAGYMTRTGELVAVPETARGDAEFADLQLPRRTITTERTRTLADWLLSVQISKSLPGDGRLSFYAFNAFDRVGQYPRPGWAPRLHPPVRFGFDITMVPGALVGRSGSEP